MAGTDRSRSLVLSGPSVVLVQPQLGENIGAAARAMLNFGLGDLRLVNPRDGWPSDKARASASGADVVIDAATVSTTTAQAIADLQLVFAMTARPRDMHKDVVTPRAAAAEIRSALAEGVRCGILFGPERAGLHNDDISLAHKIVTIPANPGFSSLNLAQSVLLFAYEFYSLSDETPAVREVTRGSEPAPAADLAGLFEHLEGELLRSGFLYPPEKAPTMVRNIRAILLRAGLTEQEVRTLRGVVGSLSRGRNGT